MRAIGESRDTGSGQKRRFETVGIVALERLCGHVDVGRADEVWRFEHGSVAVPCSAQQSRAYVWRHDGR